MNHDALLLVTAALATMDALKERIERGDEADRLLVGPVTAAVDSLHQVRRAVEADAYCAACAGPCVADGGIPHLQATVSISSTASTEPPDRI